MSTFKKAVKAEIEQVKQFWFIPVVAYTLLALFYLSIGVDAEGWLYGTLTFLVFFFGVGVIANVIFADDYYDEHIEKLDEEISLIENQIQLMKDDKRNGGL